MKKVLLMLIVLMSATGVYAQNLSMSQLLSIRKMSVGGVDDFLTSKGWAFEDASAPEEGKLGSAEYTYLKDNMSDRAQSFIIFYYNDSSSTSRLSVQVNKRLKYLEYMNAIKGYGCRLIHSGTEDGAVVKVYRGATTTFKIRSTTSENFYDTQTAIWTIFITTNDDYDLNFSTYDDSPVY